MPMKKTLMLIDISDPTIEHTLAIDNVKQNSEYLVVGLYMSPDKKMKLTGSNFEQYMWLSSNGNVDEILPYCTEVDVHNIMNFYPMKYIWVGKQYSMTSFSGKDICDSRGVEIKYFDQHITFAYYNQ